MGYEEALHLRSPNGSVVLTVNDAGQLLVNGSAQGIAANIPESQVTNLVSDLAAKAPLASPTLTGTVTVPTPSAGDNTTKAASTAYVVAALLSGAMGSVGGGGSFDVRAYGAVGDWRQVQDGGITSGSAILTSATAAFSTADVGKPIMVTGADVAGATLVTTVLSRQSATQVTLSGNASTTVAGQYVELGTDNSTALAAAQSAAAFAGGKVRVPAGTYALATPLNPKSRVTWEGDGPTVSVLRQQTSNPIFYHPTIGQGGVAVSGFQIESLGFTGPVVSTVTVPTRARTASAPGTTIAISIDASLDPNVTAPAFTGFSMTNCDVSNTTSLPIRIFGVTGRCVVTRSRFRNCQDAGFGYNQELILSNCESKDSADNGFSISRGNTKITVTGNTVENACYDGLWFSGFAGAVGPTNFTVTGNTVTVCGRAGLSLIDAPNYGNVTGNMLYGGYFRGEVATGDDTLCCGIVLRGSSSSPTSPGTSLSLGLLVSSNVIRGFPRAGVLVDGASACTVESNLILDIGSQFFADGTTPITSSFTSQNIGIHVDSPATCTNVVIRDNDVIDTRTTPYCNWAVQPNPASGGVIFSGNTMAGCRNASNQPQLVGQLGAFVRFSASGSYTVPNGITALEIIAVGSGGGGAGGGSALTSGGTSTQAGGGGGGAGATVQQIFDVTAGTVLTVTIGAAGAAGTGGAVNSNPGVVGGNGNQSTVVGSGVAIAATGGRGGNPSTANSTTGGLGGGTGSAPAASVLGAGGAGGVGSNGGWGYAGSGGGGGGIASATFGGGGGAATGAGQQISIAGTTAASGTTAGVAGGAGATPGAGGGGGGGGAPGGAGGAGGAGASGYVIIRPAG